MSQIKDVNISEITEDYMMTYSAAVLLGRAIPDFRDGLKPSTRRILYTMYANNINTFTKSLNVTGKVSRVHPHGSAYPTIVGMCQTDKHAVPYLEYNGNLGQHTSRDLQPADARYTDIRLSKFTLDLLNDNLKKDTVSFHSNYDGTIQLPDVMPVRFPTILTHAQSGIGVGYASNIPSYNLNEVADTVIEYIEKDKMKPLIPDFATGGYIVKNDNSIKNINDKGRGTIRIRGKAKIDGREISITEIPYTTTREAIIDKIVELAKDELSEVSNVIDLTGNDKMEILVVAKRGTDMDLLLEKLYQLTPLESTHSSNNMVLVDGLPKQLGISTMLKKWITWRKECVTKELQYDINKLEDKLFEINILERLDDKLINKIIHIIRNNKKTKSISKISDLNFTRKEATYIYSLRLNQLNMDYINKKLKEKKQILTEISKLEDKMDNPGTIIVEDMRFFKKKYGQPRRSKIIQPKEIDKKIIQAVEMDIVDTNDYWVTITENGYILKTVNKGVKSKIRDTDKVKQQWKLTNHTDQIIVFTHSRNGHKLHIKDLELDTLYILNRELGVSGSDVVGYSCVSDNYPIILLFLSDNRVIKLNVDSYKPGVNVFANTHTQDHELKHIFILNKEHKFKITYDDSQEYIIDSDDIRFTQTRNANGQYINSRRYDYKKVELI